MYQAGEEFDYDGPQGKMMVPVGGEPVPVAPVRPAFPEQTFSGIQAEDTKRNEAAFAKFAGTGPKKQAK
jgi:hypothetical protein